MRISGVRQSLALGFVCMGLVAGSASAADLDPAFGVGGKVITDVSGRYDEIRSVTVQVDGRIVAAGVTGTAPHRDFAVARYNADGTLDRTFGGAGAVITDFAGGDDVAWVVLMQADGKIVAGGTADGDFALARYSMNGTLDPQFGNGGRVTTDFGGEDRVNALTMLANGTIAAAGVGGGADFAIARFETNGTLDATFGHDGRVVTDFSGQPDVAFALAVRPDGRVIVTGSSGSYPVSRFAVAQYDGDGSLDEAFGVGGRTTVEFSRDARAHALVLQPDGKVLVGGFTDRGSSRDAVIARLTADGRLDPPFGVNGQLATDFGGRNFGSALVFQSNGRIVVGGFDDFPPYYDFAIARYEPDGSTDGSFNEDGAILTEFGGNSWINAVITQPDGAIIAAGYARGSSGADFALVRYRSGR